MAATLLQERYRPSGSPVIRGERIDEWRQPLPKDRTRLSPRSSEFCRYHCLRNVNQL